MSLLILHGRAIRVDNICGVQVGHIGRNVVCHVSLCQGPIASNSRMTIIFIALYKIGVIIWRIGCLSLGEHEVDDAFPSETRATKWERMIVE